LIKKLLLLALVVLNFSVVPAFADDQVADITTTGPTADVVIDLPADLPPGYHTAVAAVTDPDTKQVTNEEIRFCKDKKDEIHWDNQCPDLNIVVDPATLEEVKDVASLPVYDPASEPQKSAQTQVAGFTALSVLSAGGAAVGAAVGGGASGGGGGSSGGGGGDAPSKGPSGRAGKREDESGAKALEEGLHSAHAKQSSQFDFSGHERELMGIGDRSITWKAPYTEAVDAAVVLASLRVNRFAPLLGKILIDASYLRAIFGSLSLISVPIGAFLGLQALQTSHFQPMPPSYTVLIAMSALSIFEAIGGLVAAMIFAIGVLASGHATSLNAILTVLAISAIVVSPSILAGSFRPFRRKIGGDESIWERGVDYLLAAVLTNWTFIGFINSLNVISGKQLAITGHAHEIGLAIGIAIVGRMILEDLATYLYPLRTAKFAVSAPKPSKRQQYISNIFKGIIFALVMKSFVGLSIPLFVGTALFLLPNIIKLSAGHLLPKSRMLHFATPKGGLRIVVMTLLGTLFAQLSAKIFTDPHDFLTWGFVLLSVPGLVLGIVGLLSDDKNAGALRHHPIGLWIYRVGGIAVFYLIVQIAIGKNIVETFKGIF